MLDYQTENEALVWNLMQRNFFTAWKYPNDPKWQNWRGLEIIPNYDCNLACKYCYVNRYGEQLYPDVENWHNDELILKNNQLLFNWLKKNKYDPKLELFSGEPLVQRVNYQLIDQILNTVGNTNQGPLVIPTNYSWCLSKELIRKVDDLIMRSKDMKMSIALSASIDGKPMEQNRPFKHNVKSCGQLSNREWFWEYKDIPDPRDDEFYDRVFKFADKHHYGFHPMIYSDNIDLWIENFDWYQMMLKKHGMHWSNIYLLEVRNQEWSIEQTRKYGEFIEHLIKFAWKQVGEKVSNYMDFMFRGRGFNTLSAALSTTGRGLGCSLQSGLYLRLTDWSLGPCHRQSYDHMNLGKFRIEGEDIVGVDVNNPELWFAELTSSQKSYPYCENCLLRWTCSGGCLGSNYETTGDPFTPPPTMCRLEHQKIYSMAKTYQELGILDAILKRANPLKAFEFKTLLELGEQK